MATTAAIEIPAFPRTLARCRPLFSCSASSSASPPRGRPAAALKNCSTTSFMGPARNATSDLRRDLIVPSAGTGGATSTSTSSGLLRTVIGAALLNPTRFTSLVLHRLVLHISIPQHLVLQQEHVFLSCSLPRYWDTWLPPGVKKVLHPIISCALAAELAAAAYGYVSGCGLDAVLGDYLTKAPSNPGAGDVLIGFVGSVIISFAFSMFKQRKGA